MKVSVLMITYNQEHYIAQALDSILTQHVNFDYEIVIGEDCSTDRTRSIVLDYQQRYPYRIRVLLPETNLGMMRNFMATYTACTGEYVAILEGDDFWTSPHKLQKQVDFLDNKPDFAICFHNSLILSEIDSRSGDQLCRPEQKEVATLEDLLHENFIPTLTVMFRNRLFGRFPDWFAELKYGDWPLHLLNAQFGKIGYLNESMAMYRVHGGGAASGAVGDIDRYLRNIDGIIEVYERFNAFFAYRYDDIIRKRIPEYYCLAATAYKKNGQIFSAARLYLKNILRTSPTVIFTRLTSRVKRSAGRPSFVW